MISHVTDNAGDNILIKTFNGAQHFDVTASRSHKIDDYSCATIVICDSGSNAVKIALVSTS